jgi:hypothetical protein
MGNEPTQALQYRQRRDHLAVARPNAGAPAHVPRGGIALRHFFSYMSFPLFVFSSQILATEIATAHLLF